MNTFIRNPMREPKPPTINLKIPQNIYNIIVAQQSLPPDKHQYFFPFVDVTKKFEETLEKCRKNQKRRMRINAIEKVTISKNLSQNIIENYRKVEENSKNKTAQFRERCVSENLQKEINEGGQKNRRASELVDQLLLDIYGRGTYETCSIGKNFDTEYGSSTSFKSMHEKFDETLQISRLSTKDVTELRVLIGALRDRVTYAGNLLVKQLKKKDALKSKQQKICNVVTAYLHACSNKRSEDTNMRFSPNPLPGDSGFNQWRDAMKMVAKLPGGIPPEFRKKLWKALAEKHLQSKGVNWAQTEKLCFNEWSNPDDSELGIQIVKDLHRTGCSLFCGPAGQENQALLKRVLLAYARWNKSVGYCQGFNMLAALILQVMDKNETDSVKVMIYLIEGVLPESYFANNLRGLSVDMIVFRDLLKIRLPHLSKHLEALQNDAREGNSYEPPLTNVFTMQWFLTLFCNCLPQTTVLRVWDLIFLEGNEILLRTAIAIWEKLSDRILAVNSADEFYSIMGVLTREMLEFGLVDSNTLIKSIVAIGTCNELNDMRDKYLYNITPWTQSVQTAAKKGFKLFYSDDDDTESDFDENAAVTAAYGISIGRKRGSVSHLTKALNSKDGSVIQPYAHGHPDRERLALDISALKKQYAKLRERQRQAHIILQAACARQPMGSTQSPAPIAMNHLLLGKNAIVNSRGRRLGPPKGSIPPARIARTKEIIKKKNSVPPPETIHWRDTEQFRRRQSLADDTESSETYIPDSDSSSYSENDDSSTSTELCDEPERLSDFDSDDKLSDVFDSKTTSDLQSADGFVGNLAPDLNVKAREIRSDIQELISDINTVPVSDLVDLNCTVTDTESNLKANLSSDLELICAGNFTITTPALNSNTVPDNLESNLKLDVSSDLELICAGNVLTTVPSLISNTVTDNNSEYKLKLDVSSDLDLICAGNLTTVTPSLISTSVAPSDLICARNLTTTAPSVNSNTVPDNLESNLKLDLSEELICAGNLSTVTPFLISTSVAPSDLICARNLTITTPSVNSNTVPDNLESNLKFNLSEELICAGNLSSATPSLISNTVPNNTLKLELSDEVFETFLLGKLPSSTAPKEIKTSEDTDKLKLNLSNEVFESFLLGKLPNSTSPKDDAVKTIEDPNNLKLELSNEVFETFLLEKLPNSTAAKEDAIKTSEDRLKRHKSYEETSNSCLEKSLLCKQKSFDIGNLPVIETSLWTPYKIEEESPEGPPKILKQTSVDLLQVEDKRLEFGRRNSERALKIIQENSLILHRILQQQKSSEKEDSEDELSRSPISKTFMRSESLLSKDERTDEERSSKDGDEELESGVESFSVSPALLDEENDLKNETVVRNEACFSPEEPRFALEDISSSVLVDNKFSYTKEHNNEETRQDNTIDEATNAEYKLTYKFEEDSDLTNRLKNEETCTIVEGTNEEEYKFSYKFKEDSEESVTKQLENTYNKFSYKFKDSEENITTPLDNEDTLQNKDKEYKFTYKYKEENVTNKLEHDDISHDTAKEDKNKEYNLLYKFKEEKLTNKEQNKEISHDIAVENKNKEEYNFPYKFKEENVTNKEENKEISHGTAVKDKTKEEYNFPYKFEEENVTNKEENKDTTVEHKTKKEYNFSYKFKEDTEDNITNKVEKDICQAEDKTVEDYKFTYKYRDESEENITKAQPEKEETYESTEYKFTYKYKEDSEDNITKPKNKDTSSGKEAKLSDAKEEQKELLTFLSETDLPQTRLENKQTKLFLLSEDFSISSSRSSPKKCADLMSASVASPSQNKGEKNTEFLSFLSGKPSLTLKQAEDQIFEDISLSKSDTPRFPDLTNLKLEDESSIDTTFKYFREDLDDNSSNKYIRNFVETDAKYSYTDLNSTDYDTTKSNQTKYDANKAKFDRLSPDRCQPNFGDISPDDYPRKNMSCLNFTKFEADIPCTSKSIQFSPICAKDSSPGSPPKYLFNLPTLSPPKKSLKSPLSPNKTFSPFPVQPTTRQPKELGIKLGLYKDLSPLKSPSK